MRVRRLTNYDIPHTPYLRAYVKKIIFWLHGSIYPPEGPSLATLCSV